MNYENNLDAKVKSNYTNNELYFTLLYFIFLYFNCTLPLSDCESVTNLYPVSTSC